MGVTDRVKTRPCFIASRLRHTVAGFEANQADLVIDNSGSLEDASKRLTRWLLGMACVHTSGP